MPPDKQEWEMAWYLHRREETIKSLNQLEENLKTTDKKTGEPRVKDLGAIVAILLARLDL